jgi:hypothetical protein
MGITSETVNISLDTMVGTSGDGPRRSEGPKTVEDTPIMDPVSHLPEFTAEDAAAIAAAADMVPQMFGDNEDYPVCLAPFRLIRCSLNEIWCFRLTIRI